MCLHEVSDQKKINSFYIFVPFNPHQKFITFLVVRHSFFCKTKRLMPSFKTLCQDALTFCLGIYLNAQISHINLSSYLTTAG